MNDWNDDVLHHRAMGFFGTDGGDEKDGQEGHDQQTTTIKMALIP
jgi:hypothetical protein